MDDIGGYQKLADNRTTKKVRFRENDEYEDGNVERQEQSLGEEHVERGAQKSFKSTAMGNMREGGKIGEEWGVRMATDGIRCGWTIINTIREPSIHHPHHPSSANHPSVIRSIRHPRINGWIG